MDEELNQAVMIWSKFSNKCLKSKSEIDNEINKKSRNCCVKLLRFKNQKYHESLDINQITNNKTFWKTIGHLLSIKRYSINFRITLLEKGDILSE